MALGDPYVDESTLADYLGVSDALDDALLLAAGTAATEWVNRYCGRQFNKATEATARVYRPRDHHHLDVDDFWTTTDLVVAFDDADSGSFTTQDSGLFTFEPLNGVRGGESGWPYEALTSNGTAWFPMWSGRPGVQVTAQWGWNEVPGAVTQATKVVAAFLFNMKDSPLGVASFTDGGLIRVRDIPQAAMLLEKYRHPVQATALIA